MGILDGFGRLQGLSSALMRYAFEDLRLPRMAGMASLPNVASQRVLEKIGLERRGERSFPHPAYAGAPLAWFEREADAWLAERPPHTGGGVA